MPRGGKGEDTLADYFKTHTNPTGLWANFPKYFVSLLKAYYGKSATKENDFGYEWIPKLTEDHSYFEFLYADGERRDGRDISSWGKTRRSGRRTRGSSARRSRN